jgi:hypothetical protein
MVSTADALDCFVDFLAWVRSLGYNPECAVLKSDVHSVYLSGAFTEVCRQQRIRQVTSAPYVHEQNGFAEGFVRIMDDMVRPMLSMSGLDRKYWPLAYKHARWLYERLPRSNGLVPFTQVHGTVPDLSQVRVWGSPCVFWGTHVYASRLDDRGMCGFYVGHDDTSGTLVILHGKSLLSRLTRSVRITEPVESLSRYLSPASAAACAPTVPESDLSVRPSPYRAQRPVGELRIISYTAWYTAEDHETVALLQVEHVDGSGQPVWIRASVFVHDDAAYDALKAFARTRFRRCGNEHYPLLALAHTVHTQWPGRFECVIVAHDTTGQFAMYTVCHKPSVGWAGDQMDVSTDPAAADRVDIAEAALAASSGDCDAVGASTVACGALSSGAGSSHDASGERVAVVVSAGEDVACETNGASVHRYLALHMVTERYARGGIQQQAYRAGSVIPTTLRQAAALPDGQRFLEAASSEMSSLEKKGVLEYHRSLPSGVRALPTHFVFAVKRNADGTIERYKGRCVAGGHRQIPFLDHDPMRTHAPVSSPGTFFAVMSMAMRHGLALRHCDVATAFLNSPLKETIYVRLPDGFTGPNGERYALLHKALYGLVQAAAEWYRFQHDFLMSFDSRMRRSVHDPCLYFLRDSKGRLILVVVVWVDDYTLAYDASTSVLPDFLAAFRARDCEVKDLGYPSMLLGMVVAGTATAITFSQKPAIQELAERYGLTDSAPVYTPMAHKLDLQLQSPPAIDLPYRSLGGALLYIARMTRPDVLYAVMYLLSFSAAYGKEHYTAMRRVLKYLYTTRDLSLTYLAPDPQSELRLDVFSDASWGDTSASRRSVSGSCIFVDGNLVAWDSTRQHCVSLSTVESEYVALSDAVRGGCSTQSVLEELLTTLPVMNVHSDNQGAIFNAMNQTLNKQTKHIAIRYHFVREIVQSERASLQYVRTLDNPADIFTKSVSKDTLLKHTKRIMNLGPSSSVAP